MKISAETLYLRKKFGDREAVRILAEAGFDCIDYTMDHMVLDDSPLNGPDYREYAKDLRAYGESLGVTFHQAHAPFEFAWEKEGVLENIAVPRIIRCLEIASIMGIGTVIVHPLHHLVYIYNKEKLWDMNMEFYHTLLPYAEKYNVRIAIENMFQFNKRMAPIPDTLSDPGQFVKAFDALNSPYITACVDVGHCCMLDNEPADMIRALGHDRLGALHIHDNDGILDRHTLPYLGNINWENTMKALADIDYDGVFTFETFLFYSNFEDDFLPTAACWIHDMGVYLCKKIERYKEENRKGGN